MHDLEQLRSWDDKWTCPCVMPFFLTASTCNVVADIVGGFLDGVMLGLEGSYPGKDEKSSLGGNGTCAQFTVGPLLLPLPSLQLPLGVGCGLGAGVVIF